MDSACQYITTAIFLVIGYCWLKRTKKSLPVFSDKLNMLTRLKLNLKTRKIKKQKDELVQYSVGLRDYCRGEPTSKTCDCEVMFGVDDNGNSLMIRINRNDRDITDVWIVLRLSNDDTYSGSENPKNLQFECQAPYERWRLTYCGTLHKKNDKCSEEGIFVKFNFFWKSATIPLFLPNDWSANLMAKAIVVGNCPSLEFERETNGYDQFGVLFGQVFIGSDELTLNLPGSRQRRWAANKNVVFQQEARIFGVCEDGSCFAIVVNSSKNLLTEAQFGTYRKSNGVSYPIDWTDFDSTCIQETSNFSKDSPTTLHFSIGTDQFYTAVINFLDKSKATGSSSQYSILIDVKVNGIQGHGAALWSATENISHVKQSEHPKLVYTQMVTDDLTFFFDENMASNVLLSGGKGASLALLTEASKTTDNECDRFLVPQGFIISSKAFDAHISSHQQLSDVICDIKKAVQYNVSDDLKQYCLKASDAFEAAPIASILEKSILRSIEKLRSFYEKPLKFAVRSSAILEDGEDTSAAGQNETFLGLTHDNEVLMAVRKCWASLYALRSVQYRYQNIQPIDTSMAVVIQVMVPAEAAGVLFTQHPVTGNPNEILITGNYGLGESVVSGEIDPDVFLLKKQNDQPEIIDIHLGQKTHQIIMSDKEDSVVKDTLSASQQTESCLSSSQILQLAKVGVTLQKLYGNPRDIEWAVYQGKVYLLQSRPITNLMAFTDWELLHEFDSPTMSKEDLTATANIGEVMPKPLTPLTISIIVRSLERSFSLDILKKPKSFANWFLPITHHRATMNIFNLLLLMPNKEIEIGDKISGCSIAGHDYLTPEIHRVAINRNGIASGFKKKKMLMELTMAIWGNSKNVSKQDAFVQIFCEKFSAERLASFAKSSDLLNEIDMNLEHFLPVSDAHSNSSKVSSFCDIIKFVILLEKEKEITHVHYEDVGKLSGGCQDVISAEIPAKISEIAKTIHSQSNSQEFISVSPFHAESWLQENCKDAFDSFQNLIARHHHRAYMEFELATETYGMRPTDMLLVLQNTVKFVMNSAPQAQAKTLTDDEIVASLKSPKSKVTRMILKKLLPLARKSVQRREHTKSNLILVIYQLKMAFMRVGELMVKEGLLPDKKLIFFLDLQELKELLETKRSLLINKATRRMKLFPSWTKLKFPEFILGLPRPLEEYKSDGNSAVTGTPVFGGIVEGRACVLKSFDEVHKIEAGDILITHSTDIGWSPYFPILGGVVTELGGLISHGAVVAREYGLPCIVGAADATNKIRFGETIVLNASKGIISIVDSKNVSE